MFADKQAFIIRQEKTLKCK